MALITLVSSLLELEEFSTTVCDKSVVTLDIEGVELSRVGTIELISIGVEDESGVRSFVFDASESVRSSELHEMQAVVLRKVLESPDVLKIIHDCRQDSDALSAHLDIQLRNVFDTVVWNAAISKDAVFMNLNKTLEAFECAINGNRDATQNIYKDNPRFWATRPVTPNMLAYAGGDVSVLFDLHRAMMQRVEGDVELQLAAEAASQAALGAYRDCTFHEIVPVQQDEIKRVCGHLGRNLRKIEEATGGVVTNRREVGFLVFAKSDAQLAKTKHAVLMYTQEYKENHRKSLQDAAVVQKKTHKPRKSPSGKKQPVK